jgi:hypothetical protein
MTKNGLAHEIPDTPFADAGLAREQHNVTFTALCPRPTPQQNFEFFFAPD